MILLCLYEGFLTMKQKNWNYLECGAEAIHVKNGSFSTIINFPVLEDEAYCKYYNYNFPHTLWITECLCYVRLLLIVSDY